MHASYVVPISPLQVTDALAHPFLSQYHDPTDEPTCPPFEFDFEGNNTMEAAELRENIVQEIKKYEPTTRKSYAPATPTGTPSLLPRPGTYAPHQPLMGGSPTASLISPASGQPYQYDTATGERGGKRRRSDGPLGPAGYGQLNLNIIFGPFLTHFSAPPHPTRVLWCALFRTHAYRVLIGALQPDEMPDSIHAVFRVGAFLQPKASTVTFDPYAGQVQ